MQGYNEEEAVKYIASRVNRVAHKAFSPSEIESLVRQAVALDLKFMQETGVMDANGEAGDNYYDDDDAYEYISENLIRLYGGSDETAGRICSLVDDYMDLQQSYMEEKGMVDWD